MRFFFPFLALIVLITTSFSEQQVNMHTWKLWINQKNLVTAHGPLNEKEPVFIDTIGLSDSDTIKFEYYSDVIRSGNYTTRLYLTSPDGIQELVAEVTNDYRYAYFNLGKFKQICRDRKCNNLALAFSDRYIDPNQKKSDSDFSEPLGMAIIQLR